MENEINAGIKILTIEKGTSLNGNDVLKVSLDVRGEKKEIFGDEALTGVEEIGTKKQIETAIQIYKDCKKVYSERATERLLNNMLGRNLKLDFKTVEFGGIGDSYGGETDSRVFVPCDADWEPVCIQEYEEPHTWDDSRGYQSYERYKVYLIQLNGEMFAVKNMENVTYNGNDYYVDIYKCPQIKQ